MLCLAACADQDAHMLVDGKPVAGRVRLRQRQVGYMGGTLQKAGEVGFHRPTCLNGGTLNVGTGVLDYQGSGYAFGVRGLGAEGIDVGDIDAKGEVYGLKRLQDFSGTYVRAAQLTVGGLWLKNATGVTIHLVSKQSAILILAGDAVLIRLNH